MKYQLLALLTLSSLLFPFTQPATAATCSDFTTQEEAQRYYNQHGGRLDRDQDGIACEDLPSNGYSTSQSASSSTCRYWLKPDTNVRSGPSTDSGIIATMRSNRDPLTVHSTQTGRDGQNWSWISFNYGGDETPGWVRSDLIVCR